MWLETVVTVTERVLNGSWAWVVSVGNADGRGGGGGGDGGGGGCGCATGCGSGSGGTGVGGCSGSGRGLVVDHVWTKFEPNHFLSSTASRLNSNQCRTRLDQI